MSKRLQVILTDEEMASVREEAARYGVTVSELVRQSLRDRRRATSSADPARKLAVVRAASRHDFPTADIDQMLEEIERGYTA